MARKRKSCLFCLRSDKAKLEKDYFLGKRNLKQIAEKTGISRSVVGIHFKECITHKEEIITVKETNSSLDAYNVLAKRLDELQAMIEQTVDDDNIINPVERKKIIISCMAESRKTIETLAKIFEIQLEQKKQETLLTKITIEVIR